MSLVRFSVAPHETLVDAFYGGLLYFGHVVVSASCVLKRFPCTKSPKFAMLCVNRAFLRTGYSSGLFHKITTVFDAPGGGGVSGGSLRSSRQAGACHPFTRSWATMPPEAPPPPGFFATCFHFVWCVNPCYVIN